ncbi:uncharacterized protein L969DRAFT_516937 [Mixia osmundae IAM 14324]|uniref:Mtf2-like C-terminal domain-containing protein n=1 Tax=Mixia osmundae (strain CBS 9802 / IAM 14324 / JCM 22182 / KY 12970) TaxID=764103 RepID=G7EAL6_MIXOS|nr:uncharacterized protein L969DRAFT_516937 [Mixia osmundae IAM 14324]KEI38195.1 hypothetical protein L969DRAFT_516937 [Mixia osmundae IAM 14324]GAA99876.1 hypothetical protein E5Q_06579 [Mixia osmundae IAM 14324]
MSRIDGLASSYAAIARHFASSRRSPSRRLTAVTQAEAYLYHTAPDSGPRASSSAHSASDPASQPSKTSGLPARRIRGGFFWQNVKYSDFLRRKWNGLFVPLGPQDTSPISVDPASTATLARVMSDQAAETAKNRELLLKTLMDQPAILTKHDPHSLAQPSDAKSSGPQYFDKNRALARKSEDRRGRTVRRDALEEVDATPSMHWSAQKRSFSTTATGRSVSSAGPSLKIAAQSSSSQDTGKLSSAADRKLGEAGEDSRPTSVSIKRSARIPLRRQDEPDAALLMQYRPLQSLETPIDSIPSQENVQPEPDRLLDRLRALKESNVRSDVPKAQGGDHATQPSLASIRLQKALVQRTPKVYRQASSPSRSRKPGLPRKQRQTLLHRSASPPLSSVLRAAEELLPIDPTNKRSYSASTCKLAPLARRTRARMTRPRNTITRIVARPRSPSVAQTTARDVPATANMLLPWAQSAPPGLSPSAAESAFEQELFKWFPNAPRMGTQPSQTTSFPSDAMIASKTPSEIFQNRVRSARRDKHEPTSTDIEFDRQVEAISAQPTDLDLLRWASAVLDLQLGMSQHDPSDEIATIDLTTSIYPRVLARTMSVFRVRFNRPAAALALFEAASTRSIRHLILGCTTEVYNELLRAHWHSYGSIETVLDVMLDMLKNGVVFNAATASIANSIAEAVMADTVQAVSAHEQYKLSAEAAPISTYNWEDETSSDGKAAEASATHGQRESQGPIDSASRFSRAELRAQQQIAEMIADSEQERQQSRRNGSAFASRASERPGSVR